MNVRPGVLKNRPGPARRLDTRRGAPAGTRGGGARPVQAALAPPARYSPGVTPNHLRKARWKPTALW